MKKISMTAVEDIKRFSNMFKGLIELGEALGEITNLEQYQKECASLTEVAKSELEVAKLQLEKFKHKMVAHKKVVIEKEQADQAEANNALVVLRAQVEEQVKLLHESKELFEKQKSENEMVFLSMVSDQRSKLESLKLQISESESKLADVKKQLEQIKGGI